jgi:hypothetical protein
MAFQPPTFNLSVNIWRNGNPNYASPDVTVGANLAYGRRIAPPGSVNEGVMILLLPALTDIRGYWDGVDSDYVEAPAGSHRFYLVSNVDDAGKGFPNEHRCAVITQIPDGIFGFPFPVPLP